MFLNRLRNNFTITSVFTNMFVNCIWCLYQYTLYSILQSYICLIFISMNTSLRTKEIATSSFVWAISIAKQAIQESGFWILYEIDFKEKIHEKLWKEIHECTQLWICSAKIWYQVLEVDSAFGCLLPCSLCVYQQWEKWYLSTLSPTAQLWVTENETIQSLWKEADRLMQGLFDLM